MQKYILSKKHSRARNTNNENIIYGKRDNTLSGLYQKCILVRRSKNCGTNRIFVKKMK